MPHRHSALMLAQETETTFTITAVAAGETTLTIYATNDPMNDEADAIPVTYSNKKVDTQ